MEDLVNPAIKAMIACRWTGIVMQKLFCSLGSGDDATNRLKKNDKFMSIRRTDQSRILSFQIQNALNGVIKVVKSFNHYKIFVCKLLLEICKCKL